MVTTKTEGGKQSKEWERLWGGGEEGAVRSGWAAAEGRWEQEHGRSLGGRHGTCRRGRPGEGPGPERAGGQLALTEGGTLSNSFSLSGPRFPHAYCRI